MSTMRTKCRKQSLESSMLVHLIIGSVHKQVITAKYGSKHVEFLKEKKTDFFYMQMSIQLWS